MLSAKEVWPGSITTVSWSMPRDKEWSNSLSYCETHTKARGSGIACRGLSLIGSNFFPEPSHIPKDRHQPNNEADN